MSPFLFLTAVLGCSADTVAWPVPNIRVEPMDIEFSQVGVGVESIVTVDIVNTGTDTESLRASVGPPFDLVLNTLNVPADSVVGLQISVRPEDWSTLQSSLELDGDLTHLSVGVSATAAEDYDADGFRAVGVGGDDCDDLRAAVHPGVTEVCNGLDDDCEGSTDQGAENELAWYPDADKDGFGELVAPVAACVSPIPGWTPQSGDCNDNDEDVFPGAAEVWYDGVDGDCSGGSDFDRDGDGYDAPPGLDCLDSDASISPAAVEIPRNAVDENCDDVFG